MLKKGCDFIKKIFILLVVFAILLTSCACEDSGFSDKESASTQSDVHKQTYVANGLGISFQYDSDWYVDDSGRDKAELSILYDTTVKATIYLLDQSIDLNTGTENNIGNLLKAKYTETAEGFYQSKVVSVGGFQHVKTDKAEWIQMMAEIENKYFENYTGYLFSPPALVAFYFVNIQNTGYFIKLESQVSNMDFFFKMNNLVDSIFFIHIPYASSDAFSLKNWFMEEYHMWMM